MSCQSDTFAWLVRCNRNKGEMNRPFAIEIAAVVALTSCLDAAAPNARTQAPPNPVTRGVLWKDPGNIAAKDLFWGSGGPKGAPKPPFEFLEEDRSGTKPKVLVRDASGTEWNVKFRVNDPQGDEAPAEVAATRIAWALGFIAEECYYVAGGDIRHLPATERKSPYLNADGTFLGGARFEKRPPSIERTGVEWSFEKNPFVGTKEFSGLQILMTLLSNWDSHDSNNKIFEVTNADGVRQQLYLVSDWGSSFGRMGPPGFLSRRSRWNAHDYQHQSFIDAVDDDRLVLNHSGNGPAIGAVPIEHARWFSRLASALTHHQTEQAFRAAGASPEEIRGFSTRLMEKIDELRTAVNCHTLSPCSSAPPPEPPGSGARGAR
jgi:hypothetical protein